MFLILSNVINNLIKMDYTPTIYLKEGSKKKIFSTLLNNGNNNNNFNGYISTRNSKRYANPNQRYNTTFISVNNTYRLINLLTNECTERNIEKMLGNKKLIPFDEYNKKIDKNLLDYKIYKTDNINRIANDNVEDFKQNLKKQIIKEEKVTKILSKLSRNQSEPCYKLKIQDYHFYKNPYESLKSINNNNVIFNKINKDISERQRILFLNNIKNIDNFSQRLKRKLPKIKIINGSSKKHSEIPIFNLINETYKNTEDSNKKTNKEETEEKGIKIKLFSYFKYSSKGCPEGKELFSLCSKGKYLYLSGGLSTNMNQMIIWTLNMETLEWNKFALKNLAYSRYGHTSIYYQNKIFIYGGMSKIEKTNILAGLEIISLNEKSFILSGSKNAPCKRKNHIAELVGNSMFIHGGLDEDNQILDDCHLLNLQQMKWSLPKINSNIPAPKLFGHSSCLVVPYHVLINNAFNVYRIPKNNTTIQTGMKNIQKGIYIFGGKSKEINGLTNNLWILLLGQTPLQWVKADTKGIQPSPRYYHSMNFFEKSRYIIIHGGRNDELSSTAALNDTFILELTYLNWIKVSLYSNIENFEVIPRFGHNSFIFSNKLIILGGMNINNYIGSSLFIVNLDSNFSSNLMKAGKNFILGNFKVSKDYDSKKEIEKEQKKQEYKNKNISELNLPPIK